MHKRTRPDTEQRSSIDEFAAKVNDLDFDPWGTEDDQPSRRRDPLRRPEGRRAIEEEEDEI